MQAPQAPRLASSVAVSVAGTGTQVAADGLVALAGSSAAAGAAGTSHLAHSEAGSSEQEEEEEAAVINDEVRAPLGTSQQARFMQDHMPACSTSLHAQAYMHSMTLPRTPMHCAQKTCRTQRK